MKLSLIVAMDKNRLIGSNNAMPWHMPADLQHFKRVTMGKPIIMGRKTFESIGQPLPGRRNIILTRQQNYEPNNTEVFHSMEDIFNALKKEDEVMLIGGGELFQALLPKADRLYVTMIHFAFEGDTYFPAWRMDEWTIEEHEVHKADEKNPHDYSFLTLKRL